ncbi:MAG: epoxyqueuosine reductase QueH [Sulfuricurvum sp.]
MLVHICCSVDSHFFLQKLQNDYPDEKLVGFFYDPNIHPYAEYRLRLLDVKRSCDLLGIDLVEGEYDFDSWLEVVRGHDKDPEKGERCKKCFDHRFEVSMQKAKELGHAKMSTSLLVSPLKSQEQLIASGERFRKKYGVEFVHFDYRSSGGTQTQSEVSKEQKLYRQDYCGCIYGLTNQREAQDRLADELLSPICGRVLPASIEERLDLYNKRLDLETKHIDYKIIKEKFLNYRLFSLTLKCDGKTTPAHALFYSTMPRKTTKASVEFESSGVAYFSREELKLIDLDLFNSLAKRSYANIYDLIYNPPSVEEELSIREQICGVGFNLSPILVVQDLGIKKLELYLDAKVYEDTKERLLEFKPHKL